ncbi:MAG: UDP-N-acetylglucosamine 2-epimerase [Symbiobacteriia bacterium]
MARPVKLLVVTYGGGHAAAVMPVAKRLSDRWDVHTLALTTAAEAFRRNGLPYHTARDFITPSDYAQSNYGKVLADRWHAPGKGISREESEAYLHLSMVDLVHEVGESEAWRLIEQDGRQRFLPVTLVARAFDLVNPDVLLTTSAPRAEQAALQVAMDRGIPSVRLEDLFGANAVVRPEPSRWAVFSTITANNLVARGVRRDHIVVTGNPAFDSISKVRETPLQHIKDQLGLDRRYTILWASQQLPDSSRILDVLLAIARAHPEWQLIVRPHPSEESSRYEQVGRAAAGNVCVASSHPIHELLAISDLVITQFSTVGLEAALMGRDLITVNLSGRPEPVSYSEMGLALSVDELSELLPTITRTATSDSIRETLSRNRRQLPAPGRATDNVIELLRELAS